MDVSIGGQVEVPTPVRVVSVRGARGLGGDGDCANSHLTAQGVPLKSARERMNIISTYREVGSYRGAAELCGTTHKTVKRAVERAEAGGPPAREPRLERAYAEHLRHIVWRPQHLGRDRIHTSEPV